MPKAIHDRAMRLLPEMKKTYGPKKAKEVAFATATQQAYAKGEAPKNWHGERFGTAKGKREAHMKYDKPKGEYKTLKEGSLMLQAALSKIASDQSHPLAPQALALLEKEAQWWRALVKGVGSGVRRLFGRGTGSLIRRGAEAELPVLRAGAQPILGRGAIPALRGNPQVAAQNLRSMLTFPKGTAGLPAPSRLSFRGMRTPLSGPWAGHGTSKVASARHMLQIVLAKQAQYSDQDPGQYGSESGEPELTPGQKRRRRYSQLTAAITTGLLGGVGGFSAGMGMGNDDWRAGALGAGLGALGGAATGYGLGTLTDYERRMSEQAMAERIAREHALTRAVAAYT